MWISQFLLIFLFVLFTDAQPTKLGLSEPASLNPVQVVSDAGNNRDQRSPQFGLFGADYSDYTDVEEERTFDHHRKHKHHKHKPDFYPSGQYGGYRPPEYYPQPSTGGSFATASAGSVDSYGKPHGGQSQANAHSASFNFGPYSASFSVAEASSGGQVY